MKINIIRTYVTDNSNGTIMVIRRNGIKYKYTVLYKCVGEWSTDTPISIPTSGGCIACTDINMANDAVALLCSGVDGDSAEALEWWNNIMTTARSEVANALKEWIGIREPKISWNWNMENMYINGQLEVYTHLSQQAYDNDTVTLYRWESDNMRTDKILESWTSDKSVAMSYNDICSGHLVTKEFNIDDIVFSWQGLYDIGYEWDKIICMIPIDKVPMDEVIVRV